MYKATRTEYTDVILSANFYLPTTHEYLFLLASKFPEILYCDNYLPTILLVCEIDCSPFSTSIPEKEQITKILPYLQKGAPQSRKRLTHLLSINVLKMLLSRLKAIINNSNEGLKSKASVIV